MDTNYKMISSLLLAGVSTCGIARQPMQNPMEPVKERPNILSLFVRISVRTWDVMEIKLQ